MQNPIIGHQQIVEQLQRTVASDRIAGAYLFYGPEGVGKETVARYFAQLILCQQGAQPGSPPVIGKGQVCGTCLACRKVDSGNHPDLQFIRPEGSLLKIGQIRELQKQIIYEPLEARRKIYILADTERMNPEAENCLLKTLEEPPAASVFNSAYIKHPSIAPYDPFSVPNPPISPNADTSVSRNFGE